jgi:hypothetical protein
MKRYDPRRADSRTLAEKLVGLYAAASCDDLREANAILDRIENGRGGGRFVFRFPVHEARK